ncbi:endolytic transglycosylase MltG [Flavobacteriales bacterium]|nr:endolytic transglycosylase MltG [Flavobacteriales bacterium]
MKKIKFIFFLILVAMAIGAFVFYPKVKMYFAGMKTVEVQEKTDFFVRTGANFESVVDSLVAKKIISNPEKFKTYANLRNLKDATVEPGKYEFLPTTTLHELVSYLRKGNGEKEVKITLNNTRTLEDIAKKITENIEVSEFEFLMLLNKEETRSKYGFNKETIRTLFIPNTYNVWWDISEEELLARMAKEYKSFWNSTRKNKSKEIGLSQSEVSVLASIVYSETKKSDEAPKVAGVYMNRVKKGMLLQADPTLVYALGDFSIKRVLNKHKEIESPYNTYKYTGLPPGPIITPPISYLDAVLNFEKHNYIFFCARPDYSGYHAFAKTNSQHNVNARKYYAFLNKEGIR